MKDLSWAHEIFLICWRKRWPFQMHTCASWKDGHVFITQLWLFLRDVFQHLILPISRCRITCLGKELLLSSIKESMSYCRRKGWFPWTIFETPIHEERYRWLSQHCLGKFRTIDWVALRVANLVKHVERFINGGAWQNVFSICNLAYPELTFEVLAIFEKARGYEACD